MPTSLLALNKSTHKTHEHQAGLMGKLFSYIILLLAGLERTIPKHELNFLFPVKISLTCRNILFVVPFLVPSSEIFSS